MWHMAGGASGGWHLCVQENNPLLGNEEVDATGLVAPSLLHFGALGPENICPGWEKVSTLEFGSWPWTPRVTCEMGM